MAAVDAKALAQGFVPDSQGDILAAVAAVTIIPIGGIVFHNINAAEQTVILYMRCDGTARPIETCVLAQNEKFVSDGRYVLAIGDSIEADTTTASAVHFTISGGEEV